MLKHSTVESVEARQPTLLACVETLISIAVYGFIAWRYQTYVHFLVAAVFAPLFLLRTRESTDWLRLAYSNVIDRALAKGFKFYRSFMNRGWLGRIVELLQILFFPIYMAGSAFFIRFLSVFFWLSIRPVNCIRAVPENWFQHAFCVDFCFFPELIPGDNLRKLDNEIRPITLLENAWRAITWPKEIIQGIERPKLAGRTLQIFGLLLTLSPIIIAYGVSLFYRIGFKATFIFYFPLVWVSSTGLNDGRPVYERLSRFGAGELEKARRALSLVIAPIVALKVAVMLGFIDLKAAMANLIESAWLETFLSPGFWRWWIAAITVEIVLTFALFFFADEAIARKDGTKPWPAQRVESVAAALITLRSAVAVVLVCSGVAFAASAFLKTI